MRNEFEQNSEKVQERGHNERLDAVFGRAETYPPSGGPDVVGKKRSDLFRSWNRIRGPYSLGRGRH